MPAQTRQSQHTAGACTASVCQHAKPCSAMRALLDWLPVPLTTEWQPAPSCPGPLPSAVHSRSTAPWRTTCGRRGGAAGWTVCSSGKLLDAGCRFLDVQLGAARCHCAARCISHLSIDSTACFREMPALAAGLLLCTDQACSRLSHSRAVQAVQACTVKGSGQAAQRPHGPCLYRLHMVSCGALWESSC